MAEPVRPGRDADAQLRNEPALAGLRRGDYVHGLSYSQESVDEDGAHLRESPLQRPQRYRAFFQCRSLFSVPSSPAFQVERDAERRVLRLAVALRKQRGRGRRVVAVVIERRIDSEGTVLHIRLERRGVRRKHIERAVLESCGNAVSRVFAGTSPLFIAVALYAAELPSGRLKKRMNVATGVEIVAWSQVEHVLSARRGEIRARLPHVRSGGGGRRACRREFIERKSGV